MQKKVWSTIIVVVLIIIAVTITIRYNATKNDSYLDTLEPNIKELIVKSLEIQANKDKDKDYQYEEVFTPEFIENIETNSTSYIIEPQYTFYDKEEPKVDYTKGDLSRVTIHLEDKKGSFFQIITFKKINGKYYIDNIQNDI
jgi:hypothetical protein